MLGKSKHKYMFENDTHEYLILWFYTTFIFRRHSPALISSKLHTSPHVALEGRIEVTSEVSVFTSLCIEFLKQTDPNMLV
jgi:hypothetical protein